MTSSVYFLFCIFSNTSPLSSSPVLEDTGCGLIALTVGSPPSHASKPSNVVKLLVGSKHHFDLVRIDLGPNGSGNDSTRILTLASGSSTGAISATEVSWIKGCIHLHITCKYCVSILVILRSIEPILEKCGHLQVQYSRVLSQYS